jgi:transcription initiation factor TFIIIB Brf1 subunit/transcription initiation factor TFIIB
MALEIETFDIACDSFCFAKKNNRDESFIKELNDLCFEENIKIEAFNIYKSMRVNIKRKENRLGLKFFCIYNAYHNCGQSRDPRKIAELVGLKDSNLTKIMKLFSYEKTGYKIKEVNMGPEGYVKEYYQYSGFKPNEQGIHQFVQNILNSKDVTLSKEYPQKVAAGLIIYYITKIHNEKLSHIFYDYIGNTESSYKDIVSHIGFIYNC